MLPIGVLVKDGMVTLNGYATSYLEKWSAVNAVKRVTGVKAITDEIEVKLPDLDRRADADIALAAADLIAWSTTIPLDTVEVIVSEGLGVTSRRGRVVVPTEYCCKSRATNARCHRDF